MNLNIEFEITFIQLYKKQMSMKSWVKNVIVFYSNKCVKYVVLPWKFKMSYFAPGISLVCMYSNIK